MRVENIVGIYRRHAPSTDGTRTNVPSVSKMGNDPLCPMVSFVWVYARSFTCTSNSYLKVGGCMFSVTVYVAAVCSLPGWSSSKFVSTSYCCSVSSITATGNSSWRLVLSVPSLLALDSALGAWYLIPAWWTTSKLKSNSRTHHLGNLPEASADLCIHLRELQSVSIMKWLDPSYRRNTNTAHTTARHSLSVLSSFCTALVSVRDQYLTDPEVRTSGCCSTTYFIWESHASVPTLCWPVECESASIYSLVSSAFRF